MAENPEENHNDEPIEISLGRENVEPKPEQVSVQPSGDGTNTGVSSTESPDGNKMPGGDKNGGGDGSGEKDGSEEGEGEGEEKSDKGESKEKGQGDQGESDQEGGDDDSGDEESEEEKEDREKKEKEKQEKRDKEDQETKEKREKEDQEKSPDKKTKEKRDKEDQKTKEKRDKEDEKEKQERRDKEDKRQKEKRDREDQEEKEHRDQQDEKDQKEKDPKKREEKEKKKKEQRAEQDWKKKKKREKEDQKKQERRDKEDAGDSIVGKRVMVVYGDVLHLGEIFIVKKLLNIRIVDADYLSTNEGRELKIGDKIPVFELESTYSDIALKLPRTDFILVDGDDSILWKEGGVKYTNEVKNINSSEKSIRVDIPTGMYWVVVDKVIKAIPSGKTEKERREEKEKEREKEDDGLFHSLSIVLMKDVIDIFKAKGLYPESEDKFLVCHFPRRIYSIYKKVAAQEGHADAEILEATGSGLADFKELDKYLAKMILKQFQIAAYYYDPEYAFENILYDNLAVLNAFNSKDVLVKKPDSKDTVSVFNKSQNTLCVYSNIMGVSFLQDIIFGERKNIIKFELWENHKYDKTQQLYNFLEFIVSASRLVSEGDKDTLQYDEINNEIANIYNLQLKALANAV